MLLLVYLNIHNSSELEQFVLIFGPDSFHRDLFITEGIVGFHKKIFFSSCCLGNDNKTKQSATQSTRSLVHSLENVL